MEKEGGGLGEGWGGGGTQGRHGCLRNCPVGRGWNGAPCVGVLGWSGWAADAPSPAREGRGGGTGRAGQVAVRCHRACLVRLSTQKEGMACTPAFFFFQWSCLDHGPRRPGFVSRHKRWVWAVVVAVTAHWRPPARYATTHAGRPRAAVRGPRPLPAGAGAASEGGEDAPDFSPLVCHPIPPARGPTAGRG